MTQEELPSRTSRTKGREATQGVIPGRFALSVGRPDLPAPSGWAWRALTDVAQLESGHTPSRKHPEYWNEGIPWIGIRDAVDGHGRIIEDTYQHISQLGLANSSARLLPAQTVCLSRTASVGYVVVMGKSMATSQDFVNWVCGPALLPDYLKYVLIAERDSLMMFASGTTHQTIYYPEAKAFHALLPPIRTQERIVDILGSIDAKIDLNRRTNETLEAIARALFKSWFVDFDPVRAKAEGRKPFGMDEATAALFPSQFTSSNRGAIPQGWEATRLADAINILDSRRIPLSARERDQRRGQYPYYGAASQMDRVDSYLFDGIHVLVGEDGSVVHDDGTPFVQYVWGKFWVNNHAHVLTGRNNISNEHLLTFMRTCDVRPFVSGAVQPKINQANLCNIPFLMPTPSVSRAFGELIGPWFSRFRLNNEESSTLAELRDTLLPRLLSGELRVPDAEQLVGNAV